MEKDPIRIPGTKVKVIAKNNYHPGVIGVVDKDYGNTVQIKVDKEFESHNRAYRSRIGHFAVKEGESPSDFREGKFIMVNPDHLIAID